MCRECALTSNFSFLVELPSVVEGVAACDIRRFRVESMDADSADWESTVPISEVSDAIAPKQYQENRTAIEWPVYGHFTCDLEEQANEPLVPGSLTGQSGSAGRICPFPRAPAFSSSSVSATNQALKHATSQHTPNNNQNVIEVLRVPTICYPLSQAQVGLASVRRFC